MGDFSSWKRYFSEGDLEKFDRERDGLLWLKLKSITRKKFLDQFIASKNLKIVSKKLGDKFEELFNLLSQDLNRAHSELDAFIRKIVSSSNKKEETRKIESELFKVEHLKWGGDYRNSLDRYLVSHYVKTDDCSFDQLSDRLNKEIQNAVQGYVLNSWYNYWSGKLIENIFKAHPKVLPAIGLIKSVDFFINDVPFDLKVTFFPNEYYMKKLRERGESEDLVFLKKSVANLNVSYNKKGTKDEQYYAITEKLKSSESPKARELLRQLAERRKTIIEDAEKSPENLKRWLYENQGEMRFGAENRIYVVLTDIGDIRQSWKLKRDLNLLEPKINNFLDQFEVNREKMKTPFLYGGKTKTFTPIADILFVKKE